MSDTTDTAVDTGVATDADAATNDPEQAQAPAPATKDPNDPAWVKDRLARDRKAFLRQLGFEDVEQAKQILAEASKKIEAEKSAEQRAIEATSKLTAAEQRAAELLETVKGQAEAKLSSLTPEQRAAVEAAAGDDPAKQLKIIRVLEPTWAKSEAPPSPPAPKKAPKTESAPVTDHAATYAALKTTNPFAAAEYAQKFGHHIFK